jgi:hypothetical protein
MRTKSKAEQWENGEFVRRGQAAARKKTDRETELDRLRSFLIQRGVEPFWANSALAWVRQAMAGNVHWCSHLRHPCLMISPDYKCVRRLTVDCTLHSVSESVPGRIVYTYRPGKGHTVNVKAI